MKNIPVRRINPAHTAVNLPGSFNIRSVEQVLSGKDLKQELHRHDFFFILALEKGSGKHEIDFTSYTIKDNSLFFMRPGQVHQLELKAGSTGYLAEFNSQFYYPGDHASKQLLRKAGGSNLCRPGAGRMKRMLSILGDIFREFSDRQEGYNDVIKANLGIFLIEFIRSRRNTDKPLSTGATYAQERAAELLDLLESNISGSKQASRYAEMMNLSLYQLNAVTKSVFGKNCSELVTEHIILESKRHLLATSSQVNQVAYELGYEDVSYFIRFFKKHTGYTPDAFRRNFK